MSFKEGMSSYWPVYLFLIVLLSVFLFYEPGVLLSPGGSGDCPDDDPDCISGDALVVDENVNVEEIFASIDQDNYDDGLTASFGDEECIGNECPEEESDDSSQQGNGEPCEVKSCKYLPSRPFNKQYTHQADISNFFGVPTKENSNAAITEVFRLATADRANVVASLKCEPEQETTTCEKKNTAVSYFLSITPQNPEGTCNKVWSNNYLNSLSSNGNSEASAEANLRSSAQEWTNGVIDGLRSNDPCPDCSFYTSLSLPISVSSTDNPLVFNAASEGSFTVRCGPKRTNWKYDYKLDVSYTFYCKPK